MSKLVGVGAAGGKGVIRVIESGVMDRHECLIVNSTSKDVPVEYHDIFVNIGGKRGGCGKERNVSKDLTEESLLDGTLDILDELVTEDDETVYIVSSTSGGTGSGGYPAIADHYLNDELYVVLFGFTGFEEDARELGNTIEFFKDVDESLTVQTISNKKFLAEAGGNKMKAQELANQEFVNRIKIMEGQTRLQCENNIDDTDLFKTIVTEGYCTIESGPLSNIKNIENFQKEVISIIDSSKSMDTVKGNKRMGIILNIKKSTEPYVDFDIIKDKLGFPGEFYPHIQYTDEEEFINIISAGMDMPLDEIKEINKSYKLKIQEVNTSKDNFFNELDEMNGEMDMFNSAARKPRRRGNNRKKKENTDIV